MDGAFCIDERKTILSQDIAARVFEGQEVRWKMIDGAPWFVASDLCKALKIVNTAQAIDRLDEADSCQVEIRSTGQGRWMWAVNESGMYELVFRSEKPDAKRFRKWITSEVLPALRQNGTYSLVPVREDDDLVALEQMVAGLRENRNRIRALESKVSAAQGEHDEFTTLAYAKIHSFPTDRVSCQKHGVRASRVMRARGQQPRKVQDATFGTINVYPVDVLEETATL